MKSNGRIAWGFPKGDPDSKKGGVTNKTYRDLLNDIAVRIYEPGDI